jgi:crotonobetainyl-CoA:carnitine CoA-transferase CaiB-like acyl-CoA transferase
MTPMPLRGVRVVEFGVAIAGPFATSLLADLGAEVIKVERPNNGDTTREFGHQTNGVSLWWGVSARNKKCITLDLKSDADRVRFRDLLASADIFVENFRAGVVERLGFGWSQVSKINPRLIMLSVSGFGQTGPESHRPGFGKIAEAMSGMVELTGRTGESPLHVGFSLADATTGLMGFLACAVALYRRDVGGAQGTFIDLALYEPLFRMVECQLALKQKLGRPPSRTGSNHPYGWGSSGQADPRIECFECSDGAWVAVLLDAETIERIASHFGSNVAMDQVSEWLKARIATLDVERVRVLLKELGIEAARVHDGASIAATPYFKNRGDVLRAFDERIGELATAAVVPRMYSRDGINAFRTPALGEDNESYR